MKKTAVLALATLCLLAQPVRALLEVEAYYWLAIPDGSLAVGSRGSSGTTLDLERDLGYDEYDSILGLTAIVGDVHQFGINVFGLDISGTDRSSSEIDFADETFPAGVRLKSTWEGQFVRAFYRMNVGASFARAGFLVGGQYLDVSTKLSSQGVGSATEDISAIMPIIGGYFVGHPLPFLGFRGSVIGSMWDLGDIDATFIDVELAGETTFLGMFLAGGYRYTTIDASDNSQPLDVDISLSGPIVYLGFEW